MKRKAHSTEEIIRILRQADFGGIEYSLARQIGEPLGLFYGRYVYTRPYPCIPGSGSPFRVCQPASKTTSEPP